MSEWGVGEGGGKGNLKDDLLTWPLKSITLHNLAARWRCAPLPKKIDDGTASRPLLSVIKKNLTRISSLSISFPRLLSITDAGSNIRINHVVNHSGMIQIGTILVCLSVIQSVCLFTYLFVEYIFTYLCVCMYIMFIWTGGGTILAQDYWLGQSLNDVAVLVLHLGSVVIAPLSLARIVLCGTLAHPTRPLIKPPARRRGQGV